jgi:predicted Zn-dependent protease with MMP-like domain
MQAKYVYNNHYQVFEKTIKQVLISEVLHNFGIDELHIDSILIQKVYIQY